MDLICPILDNNNVIIELNGERVLIASGMNYSLSNEHSITIDESTFILDNQFIGFSIKDINNHLKEDVKYVLGSNILSKFNYRIDKSKKIFTISPNPFDVGTDSIPLSYNLDVPTIPVSTQDKQISAIFDTLSSYTYIHEKIIPENVEKEQESTDFVIGVGKFTVKLFRNQYNIGKQKIELMSANYPSVITKSRPLSIDKGVLGSELTANFVITLNSSTNVFQLERFT